MASVNINERAELTFRHPRVIVNGYGKVMRRGIAKIADSEHLAIKKGLIRLLDLKPLIPSDVKDEKVDGKPIHDAAIDLRDCFSLNLGGCRTCSCCPIDLP